MSDLVATGVGLLAAAPGIAIAAAPGIAGALAWKRLNPANRADQYQLSLEIESIKPWLFSIKLFIEKIMKHKINLCSLLDLIDSVNALQIFFYNNFVNPSALTNQFVGQWPEYYRLELGHGVAHVQRSLSEVLMEIEFYNQIVMDEFSNEKPDLTLLSKKLAERNSNCKRFGDWYRSHSNRDQWDICEKCTVRATGNFAAVAESLNLHEAYKRIINSDEAFAKAREAISNGKYVQDVLLVPGMYKKHGQGISHKMHLGKEQDVMEETDDATSAATKANQPKEKGWLGGWWGSADSKEAVQEERIQSSAASGGGGGKRRNQRRRR